MFELLLHSRSQSDDLFFVFQELAESAEGEQIQGVVVFFIFAGFELQRESLKNSLKTWSSVHYLFNFF